MYAPCYSKILDQPEKTVRTYTLAYLASPSAMKEKEYKNNIKLSALIQDLHSVQFKKELHKVLQLNILLFYSGMLGCHESACQEQTI